MAFAIPIIGGRFPALRWMAVGIILHTVMVALLISAMSLGTAASGILLQYTAPVWVALLGWIFRHEPSIDPARMQTFRQREYVYLGDVDGLLGTVARDSGRKTAFKRIIYLAHMVAISRTTTTNNCNKVDRPARLGTCHEAKARMAIATGATR